LQIFINLCLVSAIFLGASHLIGSSRIAMPEWASTIVWQKSLVWGSALVLAAPFLIAVSRKIQAFGLLLADHVSQGMQGEDAEKTRSFVSTSIPAASMIGIILLIVVLSYSILPPLEISLLVVVVAGALIALMWRWFVRIHYRLQITLIETLKENKDEH
jgi:monovalent cation:H+ antiporter-2, CPA2 family